MAGRPQPDLTEHVLAEHRAGRISEEVALMRLALAGVPAAQIPEALAGAAARHAPGLERLEARLRAGADHAPGMGRDATRAMFDRLVALSPEASVAAYSLGDPATLAAATAELAAWLRGLGLLDGRPRVLDLGCGIGRVAAAIAPDCDSVLGLDISPGMVAEAEARHRGVAGLRFATIEGRNLAGLADGSFDLVLAVDVFPYLVQAGDAGPMLAEAARVLVPCGELVVLNHDYADPSAEPAAPGLVLLGPGTRPLRLWDGVAFRLRRLAGDGAA